MFAARILHFLHLQGYSKPWSRVIVSLYGSSFGCCIKIVIGPGPLAQVILYVECASKLWPAGLLLSFVCPFTCLSFHRHSCSPFATQSVSVAFCLYTLQVMVFMLVFLLVCAPCEDGFFFLQLLPVCYWRCHVMSIMGSPSCLEPELAASAFVLFAWS